MVFTYNLLIASFVLIAIFIAFVLYLKIRQRLPKQQICWFCHKSQKVSYNQINSFNCLHCHQYNGFSEDGNYNKVISAQFETRKGVKYCQPISDSFSKCVQICSECNVRQEIKIKLLAEFIPFNEMNFTQECDEYKKYLEKEYKLCSNCETTVKSVLSKPINCIKDVIKNTINSKVNPNIDSVFVGQNSRRHTNWIWFSVINLFDYCSLFCAIILFVFGLNELQNKTELSIIEFPENLIQYLDFHSSNQTVVIYSGFMSSITAIIISGKQSLIMTNIFSQLVWIAMISSESPLILLNIDKIDSILLRPVLSLFLVFFSTINSSLRLFALFNTKSKIKQNSKQTEVKIKKIENSTNNELNVCSPEKQVKSFDNIYTNCTKSADHLIGEQIKSLSILDETDSTLNCKPIQHYFKTENNIFSNIRFNSSLISETSSGKSIVLPAKFHYESVAQTSWVSPFKPNTSPRKEKLNSLPYFPSSQSFARTSQWVSHTSGLVTPPPSASASVCSESALVTRFSSLDGNNGLFPPIFESQRNDSYNNYNSNHLLRNRLISQKIYSRDSITSSEESRVNSRSLSPLNHTNNECLIREEEKKDLTANLGQSFVFALFLLILFCFVIFLSLPVVIKTSCDLHSMDCRFSLENMPQNNVF